MCVCVALNRGQDHSQSLQLTREQSRLAAVHGDGRSLTALALPAQEPSAWSLAQGLPSLLLRPASG